MIKHKTHKVLLTIFMILLAVSAVALFAVAEKLKSMPRSKSTLPIGATYIEINNTLIEVDVANTESLRAQGLSGRAILPQDRGMWFIFDNEAEHPFWMKDMNFPIDIVWVNSNMQVVDITHKLSPSSYPDSVTPKNPAQYVLEVNAGFVENQGIAIGDKVRFY